MIKYSPRVQAHIFPESRQLRRLAALWPALLLACAHAPPERDTAFRQIQVYEAAIAWATAARDGRTCSDGLDELTHQTCEASRALCELSSKLDDRDATTRCLRAGRACVGAREHMHARCATESAP